MNYKTLFDECLSQRKEFYPLSQSQLGIYFECVKNPTSTMYNIPYTYEFEKAAVDGTRLEAAVETALNAHRILMCDIGERGGEIVMIPRDKKICVRREKSCDAQIESDLASFVRPFDLENDILCRAAIFETESRFVLAVDIHHTVFDGSSVGVISREIEAVYNGQAVQGEEAALHLGDFESELLEAGEFDKSKKFFDERLCDLQDKTELFPDVFDDSADAGGSVSAESLCVYSDDFFSFEQVERFNGGKGIGSFFISAFLYAAAKFAGKSEAVVYTPNHGRNLDARLKNAVGMMVRTLPVYGKFSEDVSVKDFVSSAKQNVIDTLKNSGYPFSKLAEEHDLSMDLSIAYQGDSFNSITLGGKTAFFRELPQDAVSPLTLMIFKEGEKFKLTFFYRKELYTQDIVKSFADFFMNIIREFLTCDAEKTPLNKIMLVSERQNATLDSFNQTAVEYDSTKTVVDLFREQAAKNPQNVAVVFKDKKITYKEVDETTDKIAAFVNSAGLGRENVAAVLINRNEFMPIASLGVLKAGAAYQPLDPSYPTERLEFMIEDSAAKLLIADEDLLPLVPSYKGKILLTKDIASLSADTLHLTLNSPKPNDLFILLYTSGTTGKPKGVMLEHKNLAAFCHWHRRFYSLDKHSRVAAYASYGFDANMMDMYPALTTGAEVHIIPEDMRLDILAMSDYFNKNAITHSFMTTQVGRTFATSCECKSLKALSTGGEALVPIEPPAYDFYNGYGPTECTIFTTAYKVEQLLKKVPIGKPLDNLRLYVVDEFGRRLPVGASGELLISGPQVARGYLNRPEQTQKAFTKNLFDESGDENYSRVYHTGDIVRYLPSGDIDFVGRNDGQVKVRGFRIELTEVEQVIREFDGIKDAAVAAFDDAAGGKFVAAYIVGDEKIDIEKLNAFIAERKPPYMVPAFTMQIEKIPLNVNGKVDKRKLPAPQAMAANENSSEPKTLSALEEKIVAIVEKIIGHKITSVSKNLLQEGLTSLSVIRLAVALKKEFGYEAETKKFFKGCSVISIENEIVEWLLSDSRKQTAATEAKPTLKKSFYPLSSSQFGVYADTMKKPLTTLYNIPFACEFPQSIGAEKLAAAVRTVLASHEAIFTCVETTDSGPVLAVPKNCEAEIPILKMSESELAAFKKDFVQPFNLAKPPLFRLAVVQTEKSLWLLADFHHIVFDGGSMGVFLSQLNDALCGKEIPREEYTLFDAAEAEENAKGGDEYKSAENFFSKMLAGCEAATEIAGDLNGNAEDGKAARIFVPADHAAVEAFCKNADGITAAHVYLAALCYAAARFNGSRVAYLSTISNGRRNVNLYQTLGMFVRTIPVAAQIDDTSVLDFVKQVSQNFSLAIENEIYPYSEICKRFNYSPEIVFAYQIGVEDDAKIESLALEEAKFKINVQIVLNDGVPCISLTYNDALYSAELMRTFVSAIKVSLEKIVSSSNEKIRKLSMLTEEEAARVKKFSCAESGENEFHLMHSAFEKFAANNPQKNALIACDKTLTYGELDRISDAGAAALIAKGFGKGQRAVILLSRTSRLICSMLSVMKSGGAYIPANTDYPKERILDIIADSNASLVITEGDALGEYANAISAEEILSGKNTGKPKVQISGDDEAYLIYTSGSTGKPKGVILRHEGIANYVVNSERNIQISYPVKFASVYGSVTTTAFDMSLKEIWGALSNGLTLAFADDVQSKDPAAMAEFMTKNKVDVFNGTPSRILEYLELDEFKKALFSCKVILSGGEKYPQKLLDILQSGTKAKIINTYGPTEITVSSNGADLTCAKRITVGQPLRNYSEFIIDSDDNILPALVVGELIIAGKGVAKGYNNLPEQTSKAFIEFDGKRAYRSGDFAMWTHDGEVAILGRKDNQIKLRGLRIELDEITRQLSKIEGVKNSVAVIRKLVKNDAICAYYASECEIDAETIKSSLKKSLPDYMIPSSFTHLEKLPVTANGKTDIKNLPEPVAAKRGKIKPPSTENEKTLCQIFANVLELDVKEISVDESFFALGGTSLSATRVVIQANKANLAISYADVFRCQTAEQLALLLSGGRKDELSEFEDLGNYDYAKIDALLSRNTLDSFRNGKRQPLGNTLLTGATGFLGIHVLHELLHNYEGEVCCLLRSKKNETAEKRLNGLFFYYFDEIPTEKFAGKIKVIEGDITNAASLDLLLSQNLKIDTVINCAANVKHFSKGDDIERVNYNGALNLIDFCKKSGARLVQTSTESVAGLVGEKDRRLFENELYIGQRQLSKYTQSKFMAERAILQASADGELSAKIMRLGNLSARDKDGEFQANFKTNSFMGRVKSAYLVGKFDWARADDTFEFSPIDAVAKAVLLLSQTSEDCRVFHPSNNHTQMYADLYLAMNEAGLKIEGAETDEFNAAMEKATQDKKTAEVLSSLIAYKRSGGGTTLFPVGKECAFTAQCLYRMGFAWPVTSRAYMKRCITALKGMGFFDK